MQLLSCNKSFPNGFRHLVLFRFKWNGFTTKMQRTTHPFNVFRYQDRNNILQGPCEARMNAPIQDAWRTIPCYADYSAFTNQRRKAFADVQRELYLQGIPSILIYPATLQLTFNVDQLSFWSTGSPTECFPLRKSRKGLYSSVQLGAKDAANRLANVQLTTQLSSIFVLELQELLLVPGLNKIYSNHGIQTKQLKSRKKLDDVVKRNYT